METIKLLIFVTLCASTLGGVVPINGGKYILETRVTLTGILSVKITAETLGWVGWGISPGGTMLRGWVDLMESRANRILGLGFLNLLPKIRDCFNFINFNYSFNHFILISFLVICGTKFCNIKLVIILILGSIRISPRTTRFRPGAKC